MKTEKSHSREKREKRNALQSVFMIMFCSVLTMGLFIGSRITGVVKQNAVYAASEMEEKAEVQMLPSGLAGVVSVLSDVPAPGEVVKRIGTSCEKVMVGQRFQKVKNMAVRMDLSSSMELSINGLDQKAAELAESARLMSDYDYENLLRIVEAEAGTEDIKGRVLIVNVIMNRVKNEEFPDNATDVIWEIKNGVAQFSPIADGTIYTVTISDKTREAVKQALNGTDYSEGALFFIQRNAADKNNVNWFDTDLKKLFKHGVHEFYKYPDEPKAEEEQKGS